MPSVPIAQVRRQSVFEPFFPAPSARPGSPSTSARTPSYSGTTATSTPPGTIVALTVASVILSIAFALLVAYVRRKYRQVILKSRQAGANTTKEARSPRWPEDSSQSGSKEICSGNTKVMHVKRPDTSSKSKPPKLSRTPSSGSSSDSLASYCSCEISEDGYSAPPRLSQRPNPIHKVPPHRPPIRKPSAPMPIYLKPGYPQRPERFPGASGRPNAPSWKTQGPWGRRKNRPPQMFPPPESGGQSQELDQTWISQPTMPSPSLAEVFPPDISDDHSAGTGRSVSSRHSPPMPSSSASASVSEVAGNWSSETSSSGWYSLPSIDTSFNVEGLRTDSTGYGTQPTRSQLSTLVESLYSSTSYVRQRPENEVHSPYDGSQSPGGPLSNYLSEPGDFYNRLASDGDPLPYPEDNFRSSQEHGRSQY